MHEQEWHIVKGTGPGQVVPIGIEASRQEETLGEWHIAQGHHHRAVRS